MRISKLLLLLLLTSINSYSQIDSLSNDEVLTLLCSEKWYMTYTVFDGEKEFVESGEVDWIVFHKDGIHEYTDLGDFEKGTWTYDHKTRTITTDDVDGIGKHKIIILSDTEFAVSSKGAFEWIMAFNKIERH